MHHRGMVTAAGVPFPNDDSRMLRRTVCPGAESRCSAQDAVAQPYADLLATISQNHEELKQLLNRWISQQGIALERVKACEQRLDARRESQALSSASLKPESLHLREESDAPSTTCRSDPCAPVSAATPNPKHPRHPNCSPCEKEESECWTADRVASLESSEACPYSSAGKAGEATTAIDIAPLARRESKPLKRGQSSNMPRKGRGRKRSAEQCLFVHSKAQVVKSQTLLNRITSNKAFEWTSILLILVNAVVMGLQVNAMANRVASDIALGQRSDTQTPPLYAIIQTVFCLLFVIELALRWTSDGFTGFFRTDDAAWNLFDALIVFVSVVETIADMIVAGNELASISVLRIFRIIRIVRVVRVIRVMPFFHELRLMIDSILGSMKAFLWCTMVFSMLFYMFGIAVTTAVSTYLAVSANRTPDTDALQRHFGSLSSSMVSLFMAMSGGRDWAEFYDAMSSLSPLHRALFMVYISFALFAVANVVIGVFVESAIRTSGKDRDTIIREELSSQTRYFREMQEVFEEMDYDNTGTITMDEFEQHLDDPRVIAYFSTLKLDVSDARMLFLLLDMDRSGSIDIDEFLEGCQRLKGESRNLDIAVMRFELEWQRHALQALLSSRHLVPTLGQVTQTSTFSDNLAG